MSIPTALDGVDDATEVLQMFRLIDALEDIMTVDVEPAGVYFGTAEAWPSWYTAAAFASKTVNGRRRAG